MDGKRGEALDSESVNEKKKKRWGLDDYGKGININRAAGRKRTEEESAL